MQRNGTLAQRLSQLNVKRSLQGALSQVLDKPIASVEFDDYASVLRQCASAKALAAGQRVHAHITSSGLAEKRFLGNVLMHMYSKCGALDDVSHVFDTIKCKNEYSWGIFVAAFAHNGELEQAREILSKMPFTNIVIWNSLLATFSQHGSLSGAAKLFEEMPERNVISWTAMLVGNAENGHPLKAIELFRNMLLIGERPDEVAYVSTLDACSKLAREREGRNIHKIVEDSPFSSSKPCINAIVNMYGKMGLLEDARRCFDAIPSRNKSCVSWSSMITAYAQNDKEREALQVYDQMIAENVSDLDPVAFVSVIDACASLADLTRGRAIHAEIISRGFQSVTRIGSCLIHMYGKCGLVDEARTSFDSINDKDIFSWTSMLSTYTQQGYANEAMQFFRLMDLEGVTANEVSILIVLDACKALGTAKALHNSLPDDVTTSPIVATALVSMYGDFGRLIEAENAFSRGNWSPLPTVWTAMIVALDKNGKAKEAVDLFLEMQVAGVMPTNVTFLCVISACSHAGLLAQGGACFVSMVSDYGLEPEHEHYSCVVDVVGRAGRVDDAEDLVDSMPFTPIDRDWRTLLAIAGTNRGQESIAFKAAVPLVEKHDPAAFPILFNMFGNNDNVSFFEGQ